MNKIIKAALTAKFQNADIEAILNVINATPNPEMATEIILGVYEAPLIPLKVQDGERILTYISANEWTREIVYSYKAPKKISGYFPEGTKREDLTVENFESLQVEGKRDIWLSIRTGEFSQKESTCSFEQWMKMTPVIVAKCHEEDIFG